MKRRSSDAQWHYWDVPGVSHDESRQASPFHCSSESTVYFRPADNTTTGFGDVFSCIKGCVRCDADVLSLTGMRPCNNKTTCFKTVIVHSVQINGKYSSGNSLSQNYCILPHFAHRQTDISSNLHPGSALWFHVTNHHIKRSHFRRNTLPSTYWFQIKRQYFHSSTSVCLFRISQPHKHSHPPRKVHRYAHTPPLFSPVINIVLMAMLCSLTQSQPIHQTIQLAYDHNKYAQDLCSAAGRKDPGVEIRRIDAIRWNWHIYRSNIFL